MKYAADGATITIAEDANVSGVELEVTKSITLDLNGNALRSLNVTGTNTSVTVTDTSTNGTGSVGTVTGNVAKSFTVYFNLGTTNTSAQTAADGTVTFPTIPSREGWVSKGWVTEAGSPVDPATYVATGSEILSVLWEKITHTLTLIDTNNPTVPYDTYDVDVDTTPTPYGVTLPTLADTDTHSFRGWTNNAGGNYQSGTVYVLEDDTTLYSIWSEKQTTPVTPSTPTEYTVTVAETENGTVEVSTDTAARGDKVTVTVTPNEGYVLETLTVTRGSTEVALTENEDGTYTFTMPRANVTVTATFVADETTGETGEGETGTDTPVDVPTLTVDDFTDIEPNAWYIPAVEFVLTNGIMQGFTDSTFRPQETLSRAQLAQILYNLEGKPEVTATESAFSDVSVDAWYFAPVMWAAENGIVEGYDGIFNPDAAVTREQMVAMIYRYATLKGIPTTAAGDLSIFTDADSISPWFVEEVTWAVGIGLLEGNTDGELNPTDATIRCEAAQIFLNIAQALGLAE